MKGFIEFIVSPDEVIECKTMQHILYNVDNIQGFSYYDNKVDFNVSSKTITTTLTFNSPDAAFDFYCEIFEKLKEATK